jgi:serine/threonine-protein kinase
MVEVLETLMAAHEKGVVHRDLKPGNILITKQGRPKLVDFGIAKLLPDYHGHSPDQRTMTGTGTVLGTPSYMAPEQVTGQPVGPATDLYAVGVMLFEAVTGRLPFLGDRCEPTCRQPTKR